MLQQSIADLSLKSYTLFLAVWPGAITSRAYLDPFQTERERERDERESGRESRV
jgi:hypothetical protein